MLLSVRSSALIRVYGCLCDVGFPAKGLASTRVLFRGAPDGEFRCLFGFGIVLSGLFEARQSGQPDIWRLKPVGLGAVHP